MKELRRRGLGRVRGSMYLYASNLSLLCFYSAVQYIAYALFGQM